MTTAQRAYINKEYNQYVDDECLQFRSIPMSVVNKILKPNRPVSDFTGVKRVFNNVPARPINLNALATSVARMNNLPYSQVDAISMKIGEEETQAVKEFVKGNKDPFEEPVGFAPQPYVAEKAVRSSSGVPLKGKGFGRDIGSGVVVERSIGQAKEVKLLLGDESQSYNTPPMGSSVREMVKRMDEPERVDFYSRPQFINERTGRQMTYIDKMAEKRTKEIMRMSRTDEQGFVQFNFPKGEEDVRAYLGIEPSPQVGHTTQKMDAIFGSSHSK